MSNCESNDLLRADKAKEHGNTSFKKGNFDLAVKFFSEAIRIKPKDKTLYSNRSAAYCSLAKKCKEKNSEKQNFFEKAIEDAQKVIELDPKQAKGYLRHANALYYSENFLESSKIYALGLSKDPCDKNLLQGLQNAQKKLGNNSTNSEEINNKNFNGESSFTEKKMESNKTSESIAIGIDLGTTFSCVGVYRSESDGVEIIPNQLGDRTTPSFVGQTSEGERLVGQAAKNMATSNPRNTLYDIKRLIGQNFGDPGVDRDSRMFTYDVESDENNRPMACVDILNERKKFYPEEVSAIVLSFLKQSAEAYLGFPVTKAVITVPAYFNDAQRNATKLAGSIAGLEVLRIINEPTAASLAYGLDQKFDKPINVLLFDLGGGTFDVSILSIIGGVFEVIATGGDTRLGGEDFDNSLVEFFIKSAEAQGFSNDLMNNERARRRLHVAAERAKRTLSSSNLADIVVESLFDGKDFVLQLSRAKFESLNKAAFLRCLETVQHVLRDAKLRPGDVDEIVLVGGSTRIPKLQQMLSDFFGGKELCKSLNPDEAVAYGAALQAGILSGVDSEATKDILLRDISPLSLGIELVGREMSVVIPRNTNVPCVRKKIYTTEEDYQSEVEICVFEGERLRTEHNNLLGKFTICGIERAKRGEPKLEVCFELDSDGILRVSATDLTTGSKADIIVENRSNTNAREIDRMIKDAEVYREEDKQLFKRKEACNELQNVIFKTEELIASKQIQSSRLVETLQHSVCDVQDQLDENADKASISDIERHKNNLERRIQAHQYRNRNI